MRAYNKGTASTFVQGFVCCLSVSFRIAKVKIPTLSQNARQGWGTLGSGVRGGSNLFCARIV